MKLEDIPRFMVADFEAGAVPCDEPPGLTEHAYRAWKDAGGKVKEKPAEPATWAIVELMGHVKLGGRLTEEERFGAKLGRLDIPNPAGDGFVTRFFGGSSVYSITIVTEEVARAVAVRAPAPVSPWEMPKQIAPPRIRQSEREDDDDRPF